MEFSCTTEDLSRGISVVERIVATKSTLPIIGNILFEGEKGGLKLSANNLEVGIEIQIPAKIEKEGAILIPAKTIGGIVEKLPIGNINFKVSEKGAVKISYKQSALLIYGLAPEEFPTLPKIKEGKSLQVDAELFSEMIKKTSFATSTSEDKYILNGVLFELGKTSIPGDQSNIRLVATDGYRLAWAGERIQGAIPEVSVIIPAKALTELARIFGDLKEKTLKITIGPDQVAFRYKDTYLVSRLIQGQFPDYKQVIPKGGETKIFVSTKSLLQAAERAAVIALGSANIVKFETKGGKIHLIANTPDIGSADEVVDIETKGEGEAQIAFNVRLVIDALKVIGAEKIAFEVSSPLSPGMIRPAEAKNYIYIVMPIRTGEAG